MIALKGAKPVRKDFLNFHKYSMDKEEEQEVLDTLRSGWLSLGPRTKKFEELFKNYVKANHAVGMTSCTTALHLALVTLGIKPGDEVITTTMTFASTANIILHTGAKPVLVDIELGTMNIDVNKIKEKITSKTKAIIPVHLAGHPCDMGAIWEIAKKNGLFVIEDAAHAIESEYRGRKLGGLSDFSAYSFYSTKNITTGEGGMLTTNNEEHAEKARMLSLHGIDNDAWKRFSSDGYKHYEIGLPGYNYHMFDLQAALGIKQLAKIGSFWEKRKKLLEMYFREFKDMPDVIPLEIKKDVKTAYHLNIIRIKTENLKADRDTIMKAMQAENIGVGIHYRAIHSHKFYRDLLKHKPGDFQVADYATERTLSLPLYPSMEEQDVMDVITALRKVIDYYKK